MIGAVMGFWLAVMLGWYVLRNPRPRATDDEQTCMACGASGYSRVWCNAADCHRDAGA